MKESLLLLVVATVVSISSNEVAVFIFSLLGKDFWRSKSPPGVIFVSCCLDCNIPCYYEGYYLYPRTLCCWNVTTSPGQIIKCASSTTRAM